MKKFGLSNILVFLIGFIFSGCDAEKSSDSVRESDIDGGYCQYTTIPGTMTVREIIVLGEENISTSICNEPAVLLVDFISDDNQSLAWKDFDDGLSRVRAGDFYALDQITPPYPYTPYEKVTFENAGIGIGYEFRAERIELIPDSGTCFPVGYSFDD